MGALDQLRGGARKVGALPKRVVDRVRPDSLSDETRSSPPAEPSAAQDRIEAIRDNPRLAIAIVAGALLLLAWIGWAIYVASENGGTAGLGVVIAWPAMLAAIALISLPFIGGYLLIRRLSESEGDGATTTDETEDDDPAAADEVSPDDEAEDAEDEGDDEGDAEDEDEENEREDSESEAKASTKKD